MVYARYIIFIISFSYFSSLFAGIYIGIGAIADRAQNKISSWGAANEIVPFTVPSNISNSVVEVVAQGDVPTTFYNKYQTPITNSGFGPKAAIGYLLPSVKKLNIAAQCDIEVNSASTSFFSQQTVNNVLTPVQTKLPSSFQVSEKYLYSYGVSLLPRWQLFESYDKLHVRQVSLLTLIGYRYGIFKSTWNGDSTFTGGISYRTRTGRSGLEIGAGTAISLSNKINLQFMVTQTRYPSRIVFDKKDINWSVVSKAQVNEVTLMLIWTL